MRESYNKNVSNVQAGKIELEATFFMHKNTNTNGKVIFG